MNPKLLTIGDVVERTGVSASALRFYEDRGLISSERNDGNHRRYSPDVLRRIGFIRVAQRVGVSLDDIADALGSLPESRTPTARDWDRIARQWRHELDERIRLLSQLRDHLGDCIGCGCLSLKACALYNPDDRARVGGTGPRYLLGDTPVTLS
jgi:MerR family redox-sensitive transcriptional activator SoxR